MLLWRLLATGCLLLGHFVAVKAEESVHGHVEDGAHDHHHRGHRDEGHLDSHNHGGHGGHGQGHGAHGHAFAMMDREPEPHIGWWAPAYASAFLMSVLSFAGAALMIPLKMPRIGAVVEYCSLTFAATVLVADALVHLLPHALEGADHETMTAVGIAATAGCLAILTIPGLVEWHHRGHEHGHEVHAYGIANLVTEMMHNFVDGIGLGIAWRTSASSGISTALAVAVHELPQEIGDFMVLRSAGFPVGKLLLWNFIASLTCLGGVALVHAVGQTELAATVQRYATAFTAGSFLTLALNMIFPQVVESISNNHKGVAAVRANVLCFITSMVAIYALLRIGDWEVDHGHGGHSHGHEL